MTRPDHPVTPWSAQLRGPDGEGVGLEPTGRPLSGFHVAVTCDRRSGDLIDAFARRGAEIIHAPAVRIAPVDEDDLLVADTRSVIDSAPDVVIVTTAYGMRRWVESADAAGLGESLHRTLEMARIIVRGPKARGAVRAAGLDDDGIGADERTSSVVDLAIGTGVAGRTVVIQLHGHEDVEQLDRLRAAGARVLTVAPYRWVRPADESGLARLVTTIAARDVDVVTFTSAPAVDGLVSAAAELGMDGPLVTALQEGVVCAAVGPVTAAPLIDLGVNPLVPERYRMGAMVRQVVEYLVDHGIQRVATARGELVIHGRTVIFDGEAVTLSRGPRAMLGALVADPGAVLSRERLLDELPEAGTEHALDMAMSRLRAALPDRYLVQTVVRRGYRLNV